MPRRKKPQSAAEEENRRLLGIQKPGTIFVPRHPKDSPVEREKAYRWAHSRQAEEHWEAGRCRETGCTLCRAGWALAEHPEWGGNLPPLWEAKIKWADYDQREAWDPFLRAMRRAVRKARDKEVGRE